MQLRDSFVVLFVYIWTFKKSIMKKLNLVFILVLAVSIGYAATITKTYNITNPRIINSNGYQYVMFDGALMTGIAGEPSLPYFAVSLLVPPGEVATSVKFIGEDEKVIDGKMLLFPYQSSIPLSKNGKSEFKFNKSVYNSQHKYPTNPMGRLTTGYLNGYAIAMSVFTPVTYLPAQQKLKYFSKVTIVIETSVDRKSAEALDKLSSSALAKRRVLTAIQNPESVVQYNSYRNRQDSSYNLLIITPAQFTDGFNELRNIYLSRGIKSEVATTEYISSNIGGQDLQEKIRNYIIQEYEGKGIDYVLLGGDVEFIPYRGFSCDVQSGSGYSSDDIPADLYYSGLDGTWNDDGDNKWGEPDEDDLLPDIAVARYPFSNSSELAKIINKTIKYQNSPVLGEFTTPLLAGENLYSNPDTWGRDYLNLLIGEHSDNGYTTIGIPNTYNIDSLYEFHTSWGSSTLMNLINSGRPLIYHVGHANTSYVAHLNNSDITDANFNGANGIDHNFTIFQTHGCDCGAFDDNDCILERMVNIDNFAVSVIGNSRYGWFNEGQTEGPSAHLNREMVDALFHEKLNHIGSAFVEAKIQTAPWVEAPGQWEEGALRWNFYDINILGDPALSVWTAEPIDVTVDYDEVLPVGTDSTTVNVTNNGVPMENFTCTILKDSVLHATGITDVNGNATIVFDPEVIEVGDAYLMVVGYNCLPDTSIISFVPANGPYVVYADHQILDPNGNNNGVADFGETISLTLSVKNIGDQDATFVTATLSTADDYVSITDDNEQYGAVAAGDTVSITDAFSFDVASDVPDQHVVTFNLVCDSDGAMWTSDFSIVINAPLPEIGNLIINDSLGGNGNGHLDAGETAIVSLPASNFGNCDCFSSQMQLTSNSPYLTITPANVDIGELLVGDTKFAEFNVSVDNGTPTGTSIAFDCELNTCDYIKDTTYYNNVGFIIEDFESSGFTSFEWLMDGDADWQIDTINPFNGTYCSKSGDIGDGQTSELYITLYVISDDVISFARKVSSEDSYDFLKFYIDGNLSGQWSGNTDWEVVTFDVPAGQHTLTWAYKKDISISAGSDCGWIDDIVFPATTTVIGVENITSDNEFSIFPNPGSGYYTIKTTNANSISSIKIYNTLGSVVSDAKVNFVAGKASINLSNLVPGIYFVEFNTGTDRKIKKIVQR